jgi:hypothetical protein
VAPSTIANQVRRLGRHCLLFQAKHGPAGPPKEPVVLDGFQSFEFSQYWPLDLNVLVGSSSHFVYGYNVAELRRSGSMTRRQTARRLRLEDLHGRPDPQATRKQVEKLLRRVTGGPCELHLVSDMHSSYRKAVSRMDGWTIHHQTVSSRDARTPKNPLWPVNLVDLLMRHGGANHKRETIAFSKRAQSVLARVAVFQVWRNYVKGTSERDGRKSASPAMKLGLMPCRLSMEEVLKERIPPTHMVLPEELEEMYYERVSSRQQRGQRRHRLTYAA